MGTTCYLINTSQTTKATIERDQTQQYIAGERHGFGFDYLTMKGATGYGIMHRQDKDTGEKKHFGIVFKTSRHRTSSPGTTEFCIKEITEDMGPVQTNAPARMLDLLDKLAPNPTGYAAQWRKECRETIARSKAPKAKPKAGDRVIYGGTEYTLERPAGPRRGWQVKHPSGHTYRMNARQLNDAMNRPAPAPEPAPQKQVTPAEFFRANYGEKVLFVHVGDPA